MGSFYNEIKNKKIRVGGVMMHPVHFTNYKDTIINGLVVLASYHYENGGEPK